MQAQVSERCTNKVSCPLRGELMRTLQAKAVAISQKFLLLDARRLVSCCTCFSSARMRDGFSTRVFVARLSVSDCAQSCSHASNERAMSPALRVAVCARAARWCLLPFGRLPIRVVIGKRSV